MNIIYLFLITLIPWIELRGSIPAGMAMGLDPITVFLVAVASNLLVIPIAFIFLDYIFPFFEDWKISQWLLKRVRNKTKTYVEKYGFLGLALFVAIPLPGSGAYSGALAAKIFKIKKRHATPAIILGVVIAGVLVTLLSSGVLTLLQ